MEMDLLPEIFVLLRLYWFVHECVSYIEYLVNYRPLQIFVFERDDQFPNMDRNLNPCIRMQFKKAQQLKWVVCIITSIRYWVIHSITIPPLFIAGWLFISTGLAYDVFGSPQSNEYFIESQQGIPLIIGCFGPLEQFDEFSRSF